MRLRGLRKRRAHGGSSGWATLAEPRSARAAIHAGRGLIHPSGGHEIEAEATFGLIAELAVGLAGFAGVAAAFGGRDRAYAPVELTRLRALFVHAALVLGGCLLAIALLWFGFSLSEACLGSAALGFAGEGPAAGYFSSRAYQYLTDPEASTGWMAFLLTVVPAWLAAGLMLGVLVQGGSMGLLVSGLSVQLLFGLWLFTRILTQRN